jgi:cobalt-zinc-cadmium efflux system outer membrane protein
MHFHHSSILLTCSSCLLLTGCATSPPPVAPSAVVVLPTADVATESPSPVAPPLTGNLHLEQAIAQVLLHNPALAAYSYEVRAAEARTLQARLRPNPWLEVELEEFNRDGAGMDSSELVLALGQLVELGGKRRWRTQVAQVKGELAGWNYEAKRLDLLNATAQRFMAVVIAQRRVELTASAVALSEETRRAVGERVKAGKEPALQAAKSEAELQLVRMAAVAAAGELEVSRRLLAAMWGAEEAHFTEVAGSLELPVEVPLELSVLRMKLPQNPNLARWDAEIRLKEAALASERAARIPDMKARVALLSYQEDDTDALAFGVGIPLPLFDRNQGNIAAAEIALERIKHERKASEVALVAELAATHTAWVTAHLRVGALRTQVIPVMEEAFMGAQEGYEQGKFGFLDMLDSQRLLLDAKAGLLDALSEYHIARAHVQRLTGTTIRAMSTLEMEQK